MKCEFYGKFRGIVTDTNDPEALGRIRARVPDVTGDDASGWALPCAPFSGNGLGFFALPEEGANVWIEFEHGDPEYPIWSGSWWGAPEQRPDLLRSTPADKVLLKTPAGHAVLLDDSQGSGGITLETAEGQKIVITDQGIEIDNGNGATLKLIGQKVSINGEALEVT